MFNPSDFSIDEDRMPDLAKLRAEHMEIASIVLRLEHLIDRPNPPPQRELFDLRRELSATLISHLKAEDWVLYPRLLASGDPQIVSVALAFSKEMGGLGAAYREHCEKWGADAITADWAGYCADSRHLLSALTHRIKRESSELYPLIEKLNRAVMKSTAAQVDCLIALRRSLKRGPAKSGHVAGRSNG